MSKLSWLIELLNDGHWHSIDNLRRSIDFSEFEINEFIEFLSKYNLATLDDKGLKVKANPEFRKLLVQTN